MTKRYHQPGHEGVTNAVDQLQQEVGGRCWEGHVRPQGLPGLTPALFLMQFHCCGSNNSQDWWDSEWVRSGEAGGRVVPDSCCKTVVAGCGHRDHASNIYKVEVEVAGGNPATRCGQWDHVFSIYKVEVGGHLDHASNIYKKEVGAPVTRCGQWDHVFKTTRWRWGGTEPPAVGSGTTPLISTRRWGDNTVRACTGQDLTAWVLGGGCITKLETFIQEHLRVIGAVGVGIACVQVRACGGDGDLVGGSGRWPVAPWRLLTPAWLCAQVFGMIFTCCLYRSLKLEHY
ncbi:CD151 antigen [Plecturocebus cupreus]